MTMQKRRLDQRNIRFPLRCTESANDILHGHASSVDGNRRPKSVAEVGARDPERVRSAWRNSQTCRFRIDNFRDSDNSVGDDAAIPGDQE